VYALGGCLTERRRAGAIRQAETPSSRDLEHRGNASIVPQDCGRPHDRRAIFAAATADVASPLQQSRENYVTSSALREHTTSVLRIYSDLEARMRNVLRLVADSVRDSRPIRLLRDAQSSGTRTFRPGLAGLAAMRQKAKMIALASAVLSGFAATPVVAAEREQVRAVINLITAVKMPFPERFERNVARTEYVKLDGGGETVACLRIDDKVRWCYEHVPAQGSRTEMLRIRNEPVEGIQVGQLFNFVVDYDLDGLTDVGSTTRMDPPAHAPVGTVIQFFVRGTGRGDQFRTEYQKLYDDGIQVALKYLGE
jgi:hypothetical protein